MPTFTNQAFLSYRNRVTSSNIVTGEVRDVLSVTKTAVNQAYTADGRVTYIISLINTGSNALSNLTLSDNLGAYTFATTQVVPLDYVEGSLRYFVNGTLQATPAVTNLSPLVVNNITVPAGGNALLVYETQTNGFAPLGTNGSITNTATVTGGGLTTPLTAEEVVNAEQAALLTITKAIDPVSVSDGEPLTYTFVIQNFGSVATVATDDVVVTDTFDPILNPITVTLDGVTLTEGVGYTYDATTGNFATTIGTITVPAATYTQDPTTGVWTVTPGEVQLVVTGTV